MMDTKALREKVLDLAIRGKLVPQDPNDEPASILLERIRQKKQQMVKDGKLKAKDIKNDTVIFVGEDNLHYEKFADGSVKCIEDEIPFELPDVWAWARLGAVAEAISDGDHQPPPQTSSGIPFLVISNVSGGVLSFENTRFVSVEYFNQLPETRKPRNGDLLFTVTGSYGIPVLVDTDDNFCFQRHIAMVRPCIISNRYLYIMLGSSYVKSICDNKATGIAQKTVGLSTLRELLVPIAPLSQQIKIYEQAQSALCVVDGISSDKEDLLKTINNAKAKILNLAIRGQLVPQDPADEPASVLLERFRAEKEELIKQGKIKRDKKESVIFRGEDNSYYRTVGKSTDICGDLPFDLPQGWQWTCLGQYCEKVTDQVASGSFASLRENVVSFKEPNYAIMVKTADFSNNFTKNLTYTDKHGYEFLENSNLFGGELILSNIGSIGKIFIVPDLKMKMTLAPNSVMIRLTNNEYRDYLYYFLQSPMGYEELKAISTGVAMLKFNKTDLKTIYIPLPPFAEQKRIVAAIEQTFAQLDSIAENLS